MTYLTDVLQFIRTATEVEKAAIRQALATQPSYAAEAQNEYRAIRTEVLQERAQFAAKVLSEIRVGQPVTFPYNGVNYTGIVTKINKVKAKIRITAMDAPPTKKNVVVGAEVGVPASILARKI